MASGDPRALLRLARSDRAAARARLGALSPAEQARLCCELRPDRRGELLLLLEKPEDVVPLLPELELAATLRGAGLAEGAWLLELATPAQRTACLDLDCWDGEAIVPERVVEWIDALIEAGRPTLVRALQELDPELWLLGLRTQTEVCVIGKEDVPPEGWFTPDGVCYFRPADDAAFARVHEVTQAAFHEAQPSYWQLVYGLLFESPSEMEEYALRWRAGRLADLGFPEREQAMRVYRPLRAEDAPAWERLEPTAALVPVEALPLQLEGTLVGQALRALAPERAADVLGYVLAVANAVAVADRLSLSDPDTIPQALEKAVRGIDAGLRRVAELRGRPPHEVLDRTLPLDLFRIGVTEPGARGGPGPVSRTGSEGSGT